MEEKLKIYNAYFINTLTIFIKNQVDMHLTVNNLSIDI